MSIAVHPDSPCHNCGERPALRLHPDGSIGGAWHDCPNAPPGPRDFPVRYPPGRFWPMEGARIAYPPPVCPTCYGTGNSAPGVFCTCEVGRNAEEWFAYWTAKPSDRVRPARFIPPAPEVRPPQERDAMLRRIGVHPASQGMYREDRVTVKPTPRWRAWVWPWWG